MGLLEDLNSGKYNLVLICILFIFMFHQYWGSSSIAKSLKQIQCKDNKEPMADVSNDIKEAVKQVYLADVEAIRNLSEIATKINAGTFVFPGDLKVTGTIKSQSLDSLNSKIDSVNSSLNSSISSTNTNLTNKVNSLQGQTNSINSNINNYVRYSDNIRITTRGTGGDEQGEPFIGTSGRGAGDKINVSMNTHPSVTTFKIVRP
jgi:hypothetical protein